MDDCIRIGPNTLFAAKDRVVSSLIQKRWFEAFDDAWNQSKVN